jgi:hypothetical protein
MQVLIPAHFYWVELLRLESRLSIRQFGASAIKLTGSPILS